ncbi:putative F-box domain, leucine-rich repeat domain superfamily, F-box-like domain superfamily [Helianthus debilis subsp. tardiflorus]
MDCGRNRTRMDRLSVLPDDLILKILSFVGLKDAIQTSVLSSRWRFIWTSVPRLSFSSDDFSTMDNFSDSVTHVLSRRNNQLPLSSFSLCFRGKDDGGVAQTIMNRVFSLNVQQLNVTCLFGDFTSCVFDNYTGFPLSLACYQTHKHILVSIGSGYVYIIPTPTRPFSSLTTLNLYTVTLYDGFLSMCPNLKNLNLNRCNMLGSGVFKLFRICHPGLSNLTFTTRNFTGLVVHVVTPQLKYLTISEPLSKIQISAPELVSLRFKAPCPRMFVTSDFPALEEAHLAIYIINSLAAPRIITLLQKFHNVKVLSLSMDIIELLNSSVELISHQPSPFANLKSLKILPYWGSKSKKVIMSMEVKNYLLNRSPNATLTEVLPE